MMSIQSTAFSVCTARPSARAEIRRQLVTSACKHPAQETVTPPPGAVCHDRRQIMRAALAVVSLMAAAPLTASAAALSPTRSAELAKKNKQRQLELAARVEKLKQAK